MFHHLMCLRMHVKKGDIPFFLLYNVDCSDLFSEFSALEFHRSVVCVCFSCLTKAASQRSYHCLLWCSQHFKHIPWFRTFLPLGFVCLHDFHLPPA